MLIHVYYAQNVESGGLKRQLFVRQINFGSILECA